MSMETQAMVEALRERGYLVEEIVPPGDVFESRLYRPYVNPWSIFSPWGDSPVIREVWEELKAKGAKTLVSADRLWILKCLVEQSRSLSGEFWEAGVYQGGTALLFKKLLQGRHVLRLFDTFEGMPETGEFDIHGKGDFDDSSLEFVTSVVGEAENVTYHPGLVSDTFAGLASSRIAFMHVDLDIHDAVAVSCAFAYPRLQPGGAMVFDDYGFHTCPGARRAVDEYFADKPECPLVLPTGQAVVFKMP
jgi:O-methyltransferase